MGQSVSNRANRGLSIELIVFIVWSRLRNIISHAEVSRAATSQTIPHTHQSHMPPSTCASGASSLLAFASLPSTRPVRYREEHDTVYVYKWEVI